MAFVAYRSPRATDVAMRAAGDYVRFRCDTEADLPSTNVQNGDSAYTLDSKKMWDREGGAWVECGNASYSGGGSSLPAGLIVMWGGLLANIPSGWLLCDGTNGTPDLRSKFIKGSAAATEPGVTGGALTHSHANHASHTHTYTEVVNHTHGVTDPGHNHIQNSHNHTQDAHTHTQNSHNHTQDAHTHTQNAHSHTVTSVGSSATGSTTNLTGASDTSSTTATAANATATNQTTVATNQAATATNQNATATNQAATATNQSATTGISTQNPAGGVATGTTAGPSATLTHDAVNHEPVYYSLAFIQKAA